MNARKRSIFLALLVCVVLPACDLVPGPSPTPGPAATPLPTSTLASVPTQPEATATTAFPLTQPDTTPTGSDTPAPGAQASPAIAAYKLPPGCPAAQSGPGGVGDPFYPLLGNAGYDVQRYGLDLSVDVDRNFITGTATIQARALQDLPLFHFDFQGMTIASLAVNNQAATYTRDGQELEVTPGQPLRAGDVFTTSVAYSGTPVRPDDTGGSPTPGWAAFKGGIYVASEPTGSATWYPVNDHPCDKALYDIRITVPSPYVVASNGLLSGTETRGNLITYTWQTHFPMASYLVTVDIAHFNTATDRGPGGLPILNYFPPGLSASTKAAFAKTPQMIDYFSSIFGPFPFESYGGIVVPVNLGFALETQTRSLFGQAVMVASGDEEAVISHELSHQWFGDSVSLKRWKDIWLNEGFATYAQLLWTEHSEGRPALDGAVRQIYSNIQRPTFSPPGSTPSDDLFNPGVYQRGGLTLHALRLLVGDDVFFRIMKTYASRFKYGNAGTEDFISVAQEISGKNLKSFFDGWLYAAQVPPIQQMGLQPK